MCTFNTFKHIYWNCIVKLRCKCKENKLLLGSGSWSVTNTEYYRKSHLYLACQRVTLHKSLNFLSFFVLCDFMMLAVSRSLTKTYSQHYLHSVCVCVCEVHFKLFPVQYRHQEDQHVMFGLMW